MRVLLGRGFLRVVVAIVIGRLGGGLLRRFVGDWRQYVQLVGVMREVARQGGGLTAAVTMVAAAAAVVVVVAIEAIRTAAVGAVRAQACAVTALRAACRAIALAGAASDGLHAAAAAAGCHALGARVAGAPSSAAVTQLEVQLWPWNSVLRRLRRRRRRLVWPALELHDGATLANQASGSGPLVARPSLELQYQVLIDNPPPRRLRRVHGNEALWSPLDLHYALRRFLGPQRRFYRQPHVLQARMIRLRGQIWRAPYVEQQVIPARVEFNG